MPGQILIVLQAADPIDRSEIVDTNTVVRIQPHTLFAQRLFLDPSVDTTSLKIEWVSRYPTKYACRLFNFYVNRWIVFFVD